MEKVKLTVEQNDWVDGWTTRLLDNCQDADWGLDPHLGTSLNWQLGHIITYKYFHSIKSVLKEGHPIYSEIEKLFPVSDYFTYYGYGSEPGAKWEGRPSPTQLRKQYQALTDIVSGMLSDISDADLSDLVETSNPVAKTKYEALAFSYKHQMWHCGQIAMIKRVMESNS